MTDRRIFEMTLESREFRRLLAAAFGDQGFVGEEQVFAHSESERSWRIELLPLPTRDLGTLRLERKLVHWAFTGYTGEEVQALLDRFERHAQRGGG